MPSHNLAGIEDPGSVHLNLSVDELVQHAVERGEGVLAASGALVTKTGERTGRSPNDRYVVEHGRSQDLVDWGAVNRPFKPERFDALFDKVRGHLAGKDLFVIDGVVGADPAHEIRVRVIAELAWHALFVKQLFRRPSTEELATFEPDFFIVAAPTYLADPAADGTNSEA